MRARAILAALVLAACAAPAEAPIRQAAAPGGVRVTAAGDIATSGTGDTKTSALVLALDPARALTLGDNAYPSGTAEQFRRFYDPTWGRFKARTLPSPGNHEWKTSGAAGYEGYFDAPAATLVRHEGAVAGWDLYQIDTSRNIAAQVEALDAELASNPDTCELVYGHHPRWSSGDHGDDPRMQPLWETLVRRDVELLLSGHDHNYERFAPMGATGNAAAGGTRQVVVGTGGVSTRPMGARSAGVSEKRLTGNTNWGVLDLHLAAGSYSAAFRRATGGTGTVADRFSGTCG